MAKQKVHAGKHIYNEWGRIILNYYLSLKRNEISYEIVFPLIVSVISTMLYSKGSLSLFAVRSLNGILPNVLAILIGFTISSIAVIAGLSSDVVRNLKDAESRHIRFVTEDPLDMYKYLLNTLTYILIVESFYLVTILAIQYIEHLFRFASLSYMLVQGIYVYLLLHIILIIIRAMTSLCFSLWTR